MMERELDRRRGWPWKNRRNNGLTSGSDGGSSPAPVKLFDEQEVARILQDQVRIGDEQIVEALQAAEAQHSEKEKALSEKLAAVNEKLTFALAEITVKDSLVKQHIKVAEEAVIGWEKAENEAAEFKSQLDNATKQRLSTVDRAKHLDGALKEVMQQLRGAREEHEKQLHETIVKKTLEFDKLRLEMEANLAEASKSLSDNRTQLIESRAENEALNHVLKDRSRMIADLNDVRAQAETDNKILRVRLEGLEKENFDLKYKIHTLTKELEIRSAELEYGKKSSDLLSRHHADSVKKIVKLEDECNRLRMMVRKKLPNTAAIVRMKQELDSLGKESGGSAARPRRRPLNRSQSGGVDFLPVHELVQEEAHEPNHAVAERIANMDEETRMLKEALAKRNDELQAARLMCAKTASRLTAVEEELETLRAVSPELAHSNDASSSECSTSSMPVSEPLSRVYSKDGSQKLGIMKSFAELELLAHSRSQSECRLSLGYAGEEAATVNAPDTPEFQQQNKASENAVESAQTSNSDLQVANQMCEELSMKLTVAENQFAALQNRNAANEQSVITLQDRLDKMVESQENARDNSAVQDGASEISLQLQTELATGLATAVESVFQATEALAQALEIESRPKAVEDATSGGDSIAMSLQWQHPKLHNCMRTLAVAANELLKSEAHGSVAFMSELSSTLACITGICNDATKGQEAVCTHLESAKAQISQLEETLHKLQEEQATQETLMQAELDRVAGLEREIEELQTQKARVMHRVSEVEPQLLEANARVDALTEQVKEAAFLISELRLQQDQLKQEDELIEEELLELSSSHPALAKTIRAADAEMDELHSKLAALEVELHGERRRHHDVVAKLEDLQEQIHRGVGRSTESGSLQIKEYSPPFMGEDEASKISRQEREISAAALAECQRTILALGKQLKILGFSESRELTLKAADSRDSIKRMTETMELLRWQTESGDIHGPPQIKKSSVATESDNYSWDELAAPSDQRSAIPTTLYYQQSFTANTAPTESIITDDPVSVPASPARSDLDAPSTPESPATVRRSVRTVRPLLLPKAPYSPNGEVTSSPAQAPEPKLIGSTYTRFHVRSPSETSVSSGHYNGIS